jgi:hypothetical protein
LNDCGKHLHLQNIDSHGAAARGIVCNADQHGDKQAVVGNVGYSISLGVASTSMQPEFIPLWSPVVSLPCRASASLESSSGQQLGILLRLYVGDNTFPSTKNLLVEAAIKFSHHYIRPSLGLDASMSANRDLQFLLRYHGGRNLVSIKYSVDGAVSIDSDLLVVATPRIHKEWLPKVVNLVPSTNQLPIRDVEGKPSGNARDRAH